MKGQAFPGSLRLLSELRKDFYPVAKPSDTSPLAAWHSSPL